MFIKEGVCSVGTLIVFKPFCNGINYYYLKKKCTPKKSLALSYHSEIKVMDLEKTISPITFPVNCSIEPIQINRFDQDQTKFETKSHFNGKSKDR